MADTILASLGQRYRNWQPPATFDERFGPYGVPPDQQDKLRLFLLQREMMRQQFVEKGITSI